MPSPDLLPTFKLDYDPIPKSEVGAMIRSVTQGVTATSPKTPEQEIIERVLNADKAMESTPEWTLASFVWDAYSRAKTNKDNSNVTLQIEMATRAREGKYESDELALLGAANTVWWPITDRLCNTAYAFLSNLLLKSKEPLWNIEPTPMPEIPKEAEESAIEELTNRFMQSYLQAIQSGAEPLGLAEQLELVKKAKKLVNDEVKAAAKEGLEEVKIRMADRFAEANWMGILDQFLNQFVTFPAAIICGPEMVIEPKLKWVGNGFKVRDTLKHSYRTVHPIDFFPSADSTDCQNGSFVIELTRMSRGKLANCMNMTGFLKDRIQACLDTYGSSSRNWLQSGPGLSSTILAPIDGNRTTIDDLTGRVNAWMDDEEIACLRLYGKLNGKLLLDMGITDSAIMSGLSYESEIWTIGRHVIRAKVNPSPLGLRPYSHASYSVVVDSFWGKGVPKLAREFQRICNAIVRGMANNIGYATNPVHEVNVNRMADGTVPKTITPGLVLQTIDAIGHGGDSKAINTIKFDMHAPSLTQQLLTIAGETETALGLPRFLSGDNGSAGRNLGIFAALQNNVSVTLGRALVNLDNQMVIPVVQRQYYSALDEMDMSGQKIPPLDASMVATGSTSVLEKENSKAKLIELITNLQPAVQAGLMPPEVLVRAYRLYVESMGYEGLIPEDDEVKAYVDKLLKGGMLSFGGGGMASPPSSATPSSPAGLPSVPTDGRGPAPAAPLQ